MSLNWKLINIFSPFIFWQSRKKDLRKTHHQELYTKPGKKTIRRFSTRCLIFLSGFASCTLVCTRDVEMGTINMTFMVRITALATKSTGRDAIAKTLLSKGQWFESSRTSQNKEKKLLGDFRHEVWFFLPAKNLPWWPCNS